jgi:uncharacterized OsmC-like protein
MTTITSSTPIRNGIDTAQVYGTLDVLRAQPQAARFEFRVRNRWIDGTHSRSTIHGFWGAGAEDVSRPEPFVVDASEPPVLFGHNEAPNPAEFLLHALAGCLTLTIVNVAAARKVELHEVSASLTGDASPDKLREIVDRALARSVVYDMITNGVPVNVRADVS